MSRPLKCFKCEGGLPYRDRLIALNIPLKDAATRMEVTASYLSGVLRGKVKLTPKMQLRIEWYLEEKEKRMR